MKPSSALNFALTLSLLLSVPSGHAEIYKWVDANGRTHYSESKEDAGKAGAQELKLQTPRAATQSAPDWQAQERLMQERQAQKKADELLKPPPRPRRESSAQRWDESTDAGRCNLARDLLSGRAVYTNGKPLDKNDREIAERDVRTYCR